MTLDVEQSIDKPKVGMPVRFKPTKADKDLMITVCYDHGFTNQEIADMFKVSLSTIHRYFRKHPEFHNTIRRAKWAHDNHDVENSLLVRAKGFEYDEVTKELRAGKDGEEPKMVITKVVRKKVAPDTGAIKHWLNNRDPEKWADKLELEHSVSDEAAKRLMKRSEDYEAGQAKKKALMAPG